MVNVIGGGFAGCEAAWQLAKRGVMVNLYDMKPTRFSPAHKNSNLCELVCSNSFKSTQLSNASGLLKEEMRLMGSLILEAAQETQVKAGGALAVDRDGFSLAVTAKLEDNPNICVIRQELAEIDVAAPTIVAVGPLADGPIVESLKKLCGERLYFYDAAAPIIEKSSIDSLNSFYGTRYDKGTPDYINCPLTKEEYEEFHKNLVNAEACVLDSSELKVFEGCMPVEVMAKRGVDTLRFGPMKPVGLTDKYACVQLRQDNRDGTLYNMVGFQTNLKWGEQKRVFSMIPALRNAEFVRYGVMHKNLYINSPSLLLGDYSMREYENVYFAGQISGVEGYIESASSGLAAAVSLASKLNGNGPVIFPRETLIGALAAYISNQAISSFQPMNANMGILPPPTPHIKNKAQRYQALAQRSLDCILSHT